MHRVLFVTHTAEWIGPNISLVALVSRLPSHLEPVVAMPGTGPLNSELVRLGIASRSLRRLDKWSIPRLGRLILRERISLVYGNSASGVSKNALIAARLTRRPFIYHLREMSRPGSWTNRFLRRATAVVAVSRAAADSYRGHFDGTIDVVHNGVPPEQFDHADEVLRARTRERLELPAGAVLIAHVGNVYPRKGQMEAVAAFEHVSLKSSRAHLLLLGRLDRDPSYVERVRERIGESGLRDRIHFLGFRENVSDYLAAADIFLHTATADPHPRAVIEAMAAALPVVALDVDGVGESVVPGETGLLVSPDADASTLADRLLQLIDDEGARQRLGEAGRRRAREHFSADGTADRIAGIIDRTLGSQRS